MPVIEPGHLWMVALLLVVVLIVWGPGRLPDVGSGLGRALSEFRSASRGDSAAPSKDGTEEPGSSGN